MNKKSYVKKFLTAMLAFSFLTVPAFAYPYDYEEEEEIVAVVQEEEEYEEEEEETTPAVVVTAAATVAAPVLDTDFPEELLELSAAQLRVRLIQRRITQAQFNAVMRARMAIILQSEGALVPAQAPVIEEEADEEAYEEEDYYEEGENEDEE